MYKVEFGPHTADVRMVVRADSAAEVFKGALAGMNDLIKRDFCTRTQQDDITDEVRIHSSDLSCLLVDFLNEVLSLTHINKVIYCDVNISHLQPTEIVGTIKGRYSDEWNEDIKAVTYHEAELTKVNDSWIAKVLFDI